MALQIQHSVQYNIYSQTINTRDYSFFDLVFLAKNTLISSFSVKIVNKRPNNVQVNKNIMTSTE